MVESKTLLTWREIEQCERDVTNESKVIYLDTNNISLFNLMHTAFLVYLD